MYSFEIGAREIVALVLLDGNIEGARWLQNAEWTDARDWAMQTENWIRVQEKNFQMWTFDSNTRKRIGDFLAENVPEEDLEQAVESGEEIHIEEMRPEGKFFAIPVSKIMAAEQDPSSTVTDVIRGGLLPGGPHLYSAPGD
jgi:hypothetical protein